MFRHAAVVLVVALAAGSAGAQPGRGQRHFEDATGDLPNEPVTAVAVDASSPDVLFAGLDGFVFKSDDGGEAWRPVLSFPRGIALDDTDADLGDETSGGAADSEDLPEGSAAAPVVSPALIAGEAGIAGDEELPAGDVAEIDVTAFARTGAGVRALVIVPGSADVMYVATPRGLYRTVNRGSSFDRLLIPGGVRENDVRDLAVDPARPSRLYVATAAGLLVSRDGGGSFKHASGRVGNIPVLCVAAEQLTRVDGPASVGNGVAVLVGTEHGLFRANDGGETFLEVLLRGLPPFFGVAAVAIGVASETFYAGTSQGLYVGERNAALLERYPGVPTTLVQAILPDARRPRAVVIGTRTRGLLFSYDAGNTIEEGAEQVPAAEILALARPNTSKNNDDIVAATDRGLFRSRPGTGVKISASALKKLREMWSKEPGLDETARIALSYNRLDKSDLYGMGSRASVARIMPQVDALLDVVVGRTTQRDLFVFRGGDDLPPGVDPDNDQTDLFGNVGAFVVEPAEGLRELFFVQLTWDLDKVIFNEDEIAVGRNVSSWYAAERGVVERVREAWSARRRLMTEMALGDAPRGQDAAVNEARRLLRLEELTAQLDGATGGAFSQGSQEDGR